MRKGEPFPHRKGFPVLRVGLNATCFNDRPSGAKQRFFGIYGALIRDCPDIEFVVFEPSDCRVAKWFDDAPNVIAKQTPIPSSGRASRALKGLGFWRSALEKESFDVFESFHLPMVRTRRGRSVLTLHDLRPLRKHALNPERLVYERVLRRALASVDRVIAVSDTVREEIRAVDPRCAVSTVYNGIEIEPFRNVEWDSISLQRKYDLPSEFILSVGHLEPRKNYERLVEAIGLFQSVRSTNLIIVGKDAGSRSRIEDQIRRTGLQDKIKILDGVSDLELRSLYRACSMTVFPSVYEGFGIPILEAMAARRPIALSDIKVFREITESKSAYFSPSDPKSIATTLARILACPSEQQRLVKYGDDRVRAFAFGALATQVLEIYRSLGAKSKGRHPREADSTGNS